MTLSIFAPGRSYFCSRSMDCARARSSTCVWRILIGRVKSSPFGAPSMAALSNIRSNTKWGRPFLNIFDMSDRVSMIGTSFLENDALGDHSNTPFCGGLYRGDYTHLE